MMSAFDDGDDDDDDDDDDHDDDDDDEDDDDDGGGGGDGDDVEHVCWQPFFGRNPSQELLGKSKWMHKILDLSLLFQDIGAAVGGTLFVDYL
jgi:hypothetical protein